MKAITPAALARSGFRKIKLRELAATPCDEIWVFDFPSPSPIDQENGDGQLREVWDYTPNCLWLDVEGVARKATTETEVYVK